MGCGASSLRGDDVPSMNANAKPSFLRSYSTAKPQAYTEHYETPQEHEQDLRRVAAGQQQRRPSRAAYVDPDDMPMPPKTTHQRYHRLQSENQMNQANEGWKERVKKVRNEVAIPAGIPRPSLLSRQMQSGSSAGVIVPNNARHRSFIG